MTTTLPNNNIFFRPTYLIIIIRHRYWCIWSVFFGTIFGTFQQKITPYFYGEMQ